MQPKIEVSPAVALPTRRAGGVWEVSALAYPVVLQTFSDTLMQVVDSAFVGRLGAAELGGVGFSGIWLWTSLCAFVGIATGVQTFVAQAYGAGREKECGAWLWQSVYVLLPIVTLWVLFVAFVFEPVLTWLGPTPAMQATALSYAHGRFWGMPVVVVSVAINSFFRGLGQTGIPLLATVVANVVNAVLAYALVFGRFGLPEWGVFGAGVATAFSNWIYLVIVLATALRPTLARRFGTHEFRPRVDLMRRFFHTSAPIGGQWLLDMASFAVFSTIIVRMGEISMAANQAMIQLLSLSFMQAYGIAIASGALVGRYIGARDLESAERSHRSALTLGMALSVVVAAAFVLVPEPLLSIFTQDEQVLALGRPLLALAALFQVVDASGIIIGGSLRGAGDTRWPFLIQATLAWLLRIPAVYFCAIFLGGGVFGAWIGELGYVGMLSVAWYLRFRTGAWRTVRV
jgi:multidrug resistance protein, MATE family